MAKQPYLKTNRLSDVLTLIQVLALHGSRHRTESGIAEDAGRHSDEEWKEIARQHPEFFRVDDSQKFGVSLLARHLLPKDLKTGERNLPEGFVALLIQAALDLHKSQLESSRFFWTVLVPILTTILGGLLTLSGVWLAWRLSPSQ